MYLRRRPGWTIGNRHGEKTIANWRTSGGQIRIDKIFSSWFQVLLSLLTAIGEAHPSVDRYITELPSNLDWDYGMVADQPYIPTHPAIDYIYQIEDPNANYIYSTDHWGKKDYLPYKRQAAAASRRSNESTPTDRPNSRFQYRSMVPIPESYSVAYYVPTSYGSTVYTTPYEFSRFVRPNVLYSGYFTDYTKPVYVVNNAFNSLPWNIYENSKQYAYYTVQQPVFNDVTKIGHKLVPGTGAAVNFPSKIKKPAETNLTKVNIDPITESRLRARAREDRIPIESAIIHKRRAPYGVIYHKIGSSYWPSRGRWNLDILKCLLLHITPYPPHTSVTAMRFFYTE